VFLNSHGLRSRQINEAPKAVLGVFGRYVLQVVPCPNHATFGHFGPSYKAGKAIEIRTSKGGLMANSHIHAVVEPVQTPDKPINRELANAPCDKGGHIRLLKTEQFRSFRLGQLPTFNDGAKLADQLGFEEFFFGIGKAKVSEDVVATCDRF
jgi:hypothetical protein